jgi:RNA polymerase sigma-70 factor (ECF subfamily)
MAGTFLVAWEQRARYYPARGAARAWLFGIATNLSRRHARTSRAMAMDAGRAGVGEPEDAASVTPRRVTPKRATAGLIMG